MADCTDGRCRICTANDEDGLIEHMAERLWEGTRVMDLPAWAEAGEFWQEKYRDHAAIFIRAARA
ncbi:hypothetical protein SAMN05192583_0530 [Sphingomonas gellani]|uniref:Uncharacterized protein n=1 Tax=Sphingomonas gellani TaxID=1166340 RepID=A0A1H7Z6K2_9SPHN|nr:hypothetical protein [Sphingomonas gellani]SEM53097.1 hypothetical protein SAMN05192583_0530 [Sphingomonas gellani]